MALSPPHPPLCNYHVVWCHKYRRTVLTGSVDHRLEHIIREAYAGRDAPIKATETMPDHVQLLVACDPQCGIQRLVKRIKGRPSRLLYEEFRISSPRLPNLWTNGSFVATIGGATLEVIKRYVENQRNA
ncbi:IS200/IS605 family transposase [Micromonospora sp. NPDC051227]|uniref:IS200/IS605 family transposase n=1 Tax=Micromonospora sp. NPDC051227 TaxID=3364285 RepID=UPI00379DC13C